MVVFVCLTVICCNCIFLCVLCFLFIYMFHIGLQLMLRLDQWIYLFIRVIELSNNCSSLVVMSSIPYLEYFFHLSMELS